MITSLMIPSTHNPFRSLIYPQYPLKLRLRQGHRRSTSSHRSPSRRDAPPPTARVHVACELAGPLGGSESYSQKVTRWSVKKTILELKKRVVLSWSLKTVNVGENRWNFSGLHCLHHENGPNLEWWRSHLFLEPIQKMVSPQSSTGAGTVFDKNFRPPLV